MIVVLNYNHLKELYFNKSIHFEWINILNRSDVEIQLVVSDEEMEYLFDTNSNIYKFMFLFNNGSFFKIYNKEIDFNKNPSYIFFDLESRPLNCGCLAINEKTLENPFKLQYFKTLIRGKTSNNWKTLFNQRNLLSNALILNDPYIFHIKEDEIFKEIRVINIVNLLDTILPNTLDIPYHILINTSIIMDTIEEDRVPRDKDYYDYFILDLITKIENLREYKIVIEIVIGRAIHKRKLYTNFLNVTTDKGFKIFDSKDSKVLEHNDILIETMFTRNDQSQGDTQYDEMRNRMYELKYSLNRSLELINSKDYNNSNNFYYSNLEQEEQIEIKNRLYHAKK